MTLGAASTTMDFPDRKLLLQDDRNSTVAPELYDFDGMINRVLSRLHTAGTATFGTNTGLSVSSSWQELPVEAELPSKIIDAASEWLSAVQSSSSEASIETDILEELGNLFRTYSSKAADALKYIIEIKSAPPLCVSDALRYIGYLDHIPSHRKRLSLLVNYLDNRSARIRYGATLGIASLDDVVSLHHVRWAYQNEKTPEVRRALGSLLKQLERL